jgi:hypothetical protein
LILHAKRASPESPTLIFGRNGVLAGEHQRAITGQGDWTWRLLQRLGRNRTSGWAVFQALRKVGGGSGSSIASMPHAETQQIVVTAGQAIDLKSDRQTVICQE